MKLSEDKKREIIDEMQAAYDEACYDNHYQINQASEPMDRVMNYVEGLIIEYYSAGIEDGLEIGRKEAQND